MAEPLMIILNTGGFVRPGLEMKKCRPLQTREFPHFSHGKGGMQYWSSPENRRRIPERVISGKRDPDPNGLIIVVPQVLEVRVYHGGAINHLGRVEGLICPMLDLENGPEKV
jgi:hypothetical protein